jgi:hypothetical protein
LSGIRAGAGAPPSRGGASHGGGSRVGRDSRGPGCGSRGPGCWEPGWFTLRACGRALAPPRRSSTPAMCALELRASIAGARRREFAPRQAVGSTRLASA